MTAAITETMADYSDKSAARTPVRRHSRLAGREGLFWQRTSRQDVRQILLAAKRFELVGRQAGTRNGPLGSVAIEILDYFANRISFRTGRLDPAIETIMQRLKRSRDAIVRALAALREHGFLDWLRRYVPTGNEGRGPQVQQTSNAYRLVMPARALQLLGRWGQPAPVPDDASLAQEARRAALEAHRASLPLDQRALFAIDDTELGQALARLGQAVQRESASRTEPRSSLELIGGAGLSAGRL